jgi:hypothetical protein
VAEVSLKNPLSDPLYDCIFTVEGAGLTKEQKSVEVYVLGAQVLGRRRLEPGGKAAEPSPTCSPVH